MKRKLFTTFCAALFILLLLCPIAYANSTPPVSVDVYFKDMNRVFYGTLLSRESSVRDWGVRNEIAAWDGDEENIHFIDTEGGRDIWETFQNYEDPDGFYFLQAVQKGVNRHLYWEYYPPAEYKVLVWFPDTDSFAVSDVIERKGFETNLSATLADGGRLEIEVTSNRDTEVQALLGRMTVTIIFEVLTALLFGYWGWKRLSFIVLVNLVTQLLLNVVLYLALPTVWYMRSLLRLYLILEVLVFAVESGAYLLWMPVPEDEEKSPGRLVGFAFIANVVSYAVGALGVIFA